jgi:signal peptidase I
VPEERLREEFSWEEEVLKSRRELRRERERERRKKHLDSLAKFFARLWGLLDSLVRFFARLGRRLDDLVRFLARLRALNSAKTSKERLREELRWQEEAPKSRRELRLLRERERWRKRWRGGLTELLVTVFVAVALVFGFVRPFVFEAFSIPSESMVPTLEVGDRVIANKFVYRFAEPERGDIIVFERVDSAQHRENDTLIKRVVGVEGDDIQVQNGRLLVNGEPQDETYLNEKLPDKSSYGPTTVPEGKVFMMGDNRANSGDSRIFGPVPLESLKGEAFFRFWPVRRIGHF